MQRLITLLLVAACFAGCTRQHHRQRADRDSYRLLRERTACAPWSPGYFNINIDPAARFYDPTCTDDPQLPPPAPQLYGYQLPDVVPRDGRRFFVDELSVEAASLPATYAHRQRSTMLRFPDQDATGNDDMQLVSHQPTSDAGYVSVAYVQLDAVPTNVVPPEPRPAENVLTEADQRAGVESNASGDSFTPDDSFTPKDSNAPGSQPSTSIRIVAIEPQAWESIPANCMMRAIEFESVKQEYRRTFKTEPTEAMFDPSERFALEDLVQLGIVNSREYQSQKETLYRAALRLSLERYAFQLKFSPTGNGTNVDWSHRNDFGITENSLRVPSRASLEKTLATGGNVLASFANNVVLTFNGPTGFASDIGSELFAEFTQSLLQRDIVFESLTQAERDVVYAARDYARFRKQFFRDIASDYYRLLLTYRSIEINMQDYFSNQRGFDQAKNESRLVERIPRFQVDQFEQNALNSRSRLISSCNSLEQSFDELKLRLGIPPETPINLDLSELEFITLRDEITVASEMCRRAYRSLDLEMNEVGENQQRVTNAGLRLTQLLARLFEFQMRFEPETEQFAQQQELAADYSKRLSVEGIALNAIEEKRNLALQQDADEEKLFNPRMNVVEQLLKFERAKREAYGDNVLDLDRLEDFERQYDDLDRETADILQQVRAAGDDGERKQLALARRKPLAQRSKILLEQVEQVISVDDRFDAGQLIDDVMELGSSLRSSAIGGLVPIDLPIDDAMLTALVTRFDLMNERGVLADAWRQIKLTGDDLRSVLNLRASQSIRTDPTNDNPFDFTFDESQTRVGLTFDAPLNRRAQRNSYRVALINYNVAIRNLLQREDEIKLDIRNDLRNLQLDREQYAIAVASSALANDRVSSTRLQLQLGLGNITARDFLEAQQAYTESVSNVATEHIGYILDRINLFLDLELLQVDEMGFWPELYDEQQQPAPRMSPPPCSGPAYGRLADRPRYSRCMQRMDCIPFGEPRIYEPASDSQSRPGDADNLDLGQAQSDSFVEPNRLIDEVQSRTYSSAE